MIFKRSLGGLSLKISIDIALFSSDALIKQEAKTLKIFN